MCNTCYNSTALGMLRKLYPDKIGQVLSWQATFFGVGYALGNFIDTAQVYILYLPMYGH